MKDCFEQKLAQADFCATIKSESDAFEGDRWFSHEDVIRYLNIDAFKWGELHQQEKVEFAKQYAQERYTGHKNKMAGYIVKDVVAAR